MIKLVFVMETRSSNRSDWMYIKSTIDYFYKPRTFALDKIFATTKSELIQQDVKINSKINDLNREVKVIVVADYDRDEILNNIIEQYCNDKKYDLVWMNLDVEDVYLGKQVPDNRKKSEAINFQTKKHKLLPNIKGLDNNTPLKTRHTTNLLLVLDKYISRN